MGSQKEQRTAISRVDFYFDDWLTGAAELTPEQRGVFITLCALYYSKQGRVVENDRRLAGLCDVSVRKWRSIKAELVSIGKISFIDGLLYQERCEIELVNALKAKATAQENGSKGGKKSAEIRANMLIRNNVNPTPASTIADSEIEATVEPPFPSPPPVKDSPPSPPEGESDDVENSFEEFWKEYPFVPGNPKQPAFEEFVKALERGRQPEDLIKAATDYRQSLLADGAPKPCHARTFLEERRDESEYVSGSGETDGTYRRATPEEAAAWKEITGHAREGVRIDQPWPMVMVDGGKVPYPEAQKVEPDVDETPEPAAEVPEESPIDLETDMPDCCRREAG